MFMCDGDDLAGGTDTRSQVARSARATGERRARALRGGTLFRSSF